MQETKQQQQSWSPIYNALSMLHNITHSQTICLSLCMLCMPCMCMYALSYLRIFRCRLLLLTCCYCAIAIAIVWNFCHRMHIICSAFFPFSYSLDRIFLSAVVLVLLLILLLFVALAVIPFDGLQITFMHFCLLENHVLSILSLSGNARCCRRLFVYWFFNLFLLFLALTGLIHNFCICIYISGGAASIVVIGTVENDQASLDGGHPKSATPLEQTNKRYAWRAALHTLTQFDFEAMAYTYACNEKRCNFHLFRFYCCYCCCCCTSHRDKSLFPIKVENRFYTSSDIALKLKDHQEICSSFTLANQSIRVNS